MGQRGLERRRALRDEIRIDIHATDLLVEINELRQQDPALLKRCQPILHADVVDRIGGEAPADGLLLLRPDFRWPWSENVDGRVLDITADSTGVGCRVVSILGGRASTSGCWNGDVKLRVVADQRVQDQIAAFGVCHLCLDPQDPGAPF